MTNKLHTSFINGLQTKYGLTEEDLKEYIENPDRKEKLEEYESCVCGHKIINARYIMHRDGISTDIDEIMIGNCCIRQFCDKEQRGKHCDKCKKKHHNRLDNLCNACRLLCVNDNCINKRYKNIDTCKECYLEALERERNNKTCIDCGKTNNKYIRCDTCIKIYVDELERQRNNKNCIDCLKPSKQYIRCFNCNEKEKNKKSNKPVYDIRTFFKQPNPEIEYDLDF